MRVQDLLVSQDLLASGVHLDSWVLKDLWDLQGSRDHRVLSDSLDNLDHRVCPDGLVASARQARLVRLEILDLLDRLATKAFGAQMVSNDVFLTNFNAYDE